MEQLKIDNEHQLQQELNYAGFQNDSQLLQTARGLYTSPDHDLVGARLRHNLFTLEGPQISLVLDLSRKQKTSFYQFTSLFVEAELKPTFPSQSPKTYFRYFDLNEDPLPNKDQIVWQIVRGISILSAKNEIESQSPVPGTEHLTNNPPSPILPKRLRSQLFRIGFDAPAQSVKIISHKDDLIFFKIQEPIPDEWNLPTGTIDFVFASTYSNGEIPPQVEYLNTKLSFTDIQNIEFGRKTEKDYWLSDGPIPSKKQAIGHMRQKSFFPDIFSNPPNPVTKPHIRL